MPSFAEIIMSRKHPVLVEREEQLINNRLACDGGSPYIRKRLWRAPNESQLSWEGSFWNDANRGSQALVNLPSSFGMVGRRDRTTYVNDAGRIVGKIQQYLFKTPVIRSGANEDFLANMGGNGVDALRFWMSVSETFTTQQWDWIGVSRDSVADSIAERTKGDEIKWTEYPPLSVPDWAFDENGVLQWIITETEQFAESDPYLSRKKKTIRTLWRKEESGGVSITRFVSAEGGKAEQYGDSYLIGTDFIPFVCVGKPVNRPWWFDDVEQIACQLLNLDSIHVDNLARCVFPQLVISSGTFDNLQTKLMEQYGADQGQVILQVVKEVVRGADMPIVESAEESGTTRFICPNTADLAAMPTEIERKRRLMFDITGLSLFNKESRMVQTAESKQFDQMDTESTLKNRSMLLQEAEKKLVEMSKILDPSFSPYDPVWPSSFDVPDTASDMQVVTMVGNLPDTTPSMRKIAMKAALRVLSAISGNETSLIAEANREIDDADLSQTDKGLSDLLPDDGEDTENDEEA